MNSYLQESQPERMKQPLLEVNHLKKHFTVGHGLFEQLSAREKRYVHAVDDISFSIYPGEIFCLVGESGCGKTTVARMLVGLEEPTFGFFKWNGKEISYNDLKPKKGDVKTQIVFQNPFSALSPRMRKGDAVLHPIAIHDEVSDSKTKENLRRSLLAEICLAFGTLLSFIFLMIAFLSTSGRIAGLSAIVGVSIFTIAFLVYLQYSRIKRSKIADTTVLNLFDEIGLAPPLQYYTKYPHEVSGGERQRSCIARGIILNPTLLVADEPTSMLDVSLRAGILDLLKSLQEAHDISILFITHDLATARHFGDRVGVMYVGKLVEKGDVDSIFKNPLHPYTKALIDAIPTPIPGEKTYNLPKGEVPDAIRPPSGCRFHPRCPVAAIKQSKICAEEEPILRELRANHWVACHYPLVEEQ
ncbi:MAG: oligopeptide/dipeptide ABC transporter ATP-binding protein [Candidatus Hodarchaeota archaeon]